MAFYHGVKTSEQATSVIAPVQTTAGLPVVFGTAPVHLTEDPSQQANHLLQLGRSCSTTWLL